MLSRRVLFRLPVCCWSLLPAYEAIAASRAGHTCPTLSPSRHSPDHPPPTQDQAEPARGGHDVGEPLPDLIDYGDDEDAEVPVLYAPLPDSVADDYVPLATAAGHQGTYMAPLHDSLVMHLLLNTHLRVLVRQSFTRSPSVHSQRFLQHICALTPHSSIPLLYPEATLFPTIFWCEQRKTMCGALPATMYSGMRHRRLPGCLASMQVHLLVRLLDDSLLTSHDQLYLQWAFDVLVNHQLNHNSATVVVRKGLEHLRQGHEGSVLQTHEGLLPFDELDSRHQVQRLAAQMTALTSSSRPPVMRAALLGCAECGRLCWKCMATREPRCRGRCSPTVQSCVAAERGPCGTSCTGLSTTPSSHVAELSAPGTGMSSSRMGLPATNHTCMASSRLLGRKRPRSSIGSGARCQVCLPITPARTGRHS